MRKLSFSPRAFSNDMDFASRRENAPEQKPKTSFRICRNKKASRNLATCLARAAVLLAVLGPPSSLFAQTAQDAPPPARPPATGNRVLLLGVSASGLVQKILVADGNHVNAGQVLLQIDCRPLEEEIKLRAAGLAAAQAAFERTRNGPRPEEIEIGEANLGVAQARADEAHDAFGRATALTQGVTITRAQLLEVQRDARVTAAQLEDARKKLALLKAGSRQEDIAESAARHDEAAAGLAEAKARLDQCSIRAPVSGVVQVTATLGQFVSAFVPTTLLQLTADASH
jgi:multidrug efflux pump subunit AcrA (membrane-fusion protein)